MKAELDGLSAFTGFPIFFDRLSQRRGGDRLITSVTIEFTGGVDFEHIKFTVPKVVGGGIG